MSETNLFRPAKRRKFIRQNALAEDASLPNAAPGTDADDSDPETSPQAEDVDISSILKLRRQQRGRAGGFQFSNAKATVMDESSALVPAGNSGDRLKAISDRFVGHSGQVVDVDKHMVAYIDSEMAKRRTAAATTTPNPEDSDYSADSDAEPEPTSKAHQTTTRQPASLGLLHEIDVPNPEPLHTHPPPLKPRKPRLDRFGRPLPPRRPRKRRNSEDLRRDQLVEDILKESHLSIYGGGDDSLAIPKDKDKDSGGGADADEALAAQFRAEYIDQMQMRQQQQQQQQKKKEPLKPGEAELKGPKLGGSRAARAAMREREIREGVRKR